MSNIYKRKDKTMHIAEYFYTDKLVKPFLPILSKTFITPNMITITNIVISLLGFYLAYKHENIILAIIVQVYLFLDILDGNLARYKDMKSELGAKLDTFSDNLFYNCIFIFIALGNKINIMWSISIIVLSISYGLIATYYIMPRLRKINYIKRKGIKKYFIKKGFIIGMDLGTLDIIISIFLLFNAIKGMFVVIILGYILDIIYRISELRYNEKLYRE